MSGPPGDSTSPGEKTLPLESRLRYTSGYSPHHTNTARAGAYSPQHSTSTASSSRPEQAREMAGGHSQVYNVGTLGTRLGNTLLSRAGAQSPARSPGHLDSTRSVLATLSVSLCLSLSLSLIIIMIPPVRSGLYYLLNLLP